MSIGLYSKTPQEQQLISFFDSSLFRTMYQNPFRDMIVSENTSDTSLLSSSAIWFIDDIDLQLLYTLFHS
jgi:hypothetical protein